MTFTNFITGVVVLVVMVGVYIYGRRQGRKGAEGTPGGGGGGPSKS